MTPAGVLTDGDTWKRLLGWTAAPLLPSVLASQDPQRLLFPQHLAPCLLLDETFPNSLLLHLHNLVRISLSCSVLLASFAPLLQRLSNDPSEQGPLPLVHFSSPALKRRHLMTFEQTCTDPSGSTLCVTDITTSRRGR